MRLWFAAVSAALILAVLGAVYAIPSLAQPAEINDPAKMNDIVVERLETEIVSIGDSSITILKDGAELELLADGRWAAIAGRLESKSPWPDVSGYIDVGEAVVYMATVNQTQNILMAVKQGDVALLRHAFIKMHAKSHRATNNYMGPRGELLEKGENYMILEIRGSKVLAAVNGKWIKAGGGEVTWDEVSDEFRIGDTVRLFCHNILIMDDEFSDEFGINGFIWGYSGAIIDLTSGTALSR